MASRTAKKENSDRKTDKVDEVIHEMISKRKIQQDALGKIKAAVEKRTRDSRD